QSGPNTGPDEHGTVRMISDVSDGYSYPDVANTIKVTLATGADINEFVVTIENLSGSPTPISPGAWVIHTGDNPLFTEMMTEPGHGLEHQAEDGDPTTLADYLAGISGLNTPLAPGIFVVHKSNRMPLFTDGNAASAGIEALAEDGNPTVIDMALDGMSDITKGIFSMPDGGSSAGPLFPGHSFTFMFKASKGDRLSFGSMFGQSNDIFFGFDDKGLALWKGNTPVSGDVTSYVKLWDAGTEVNERPGLGINQAPRQSGPNTGPDENGVVMQVNDGFTYPSVGQLVKVTITPN
ncbi:MAG: spondin domain-containing protein, partial [Flavobacteriales bacterium]|nr:spondin domain-containing protein [Flavobacteriales bacterium]